MNCCYHWTSQRLKGDPVNCSVLFELRKILLLEWEPASMVSTSRCLLDQTVTDPLLEGDLSEMRPHQLMVDVLLTIETSLQLNRERSLLSEMNYFN